MKITGPIHYISTPATRQDTAYQKGVRLGEGMLHLHGILNAEQILSAAMKAVLQVRQRRNITLIASQSYDGVVSTQIWAKEMHKGEHQKGDR